MDDFFRLMQILLIKQMFYSAQIREICMSF